MTWCVCFCGCRLRHGWLVDLTDMSTTTWQLAGLCCSPPPTLLAPFSARYHWKKRKYQTWAHLFRHNFNVFFLHSYIFWVNYCHIITIIILIYVPVIIFDKCLRSSKTVCVCFFYKSFYLSVRLFETFWRLEQTSSVGLYLVSALLELACFSSYSFLKFSMSFKI